MHSMKGYRKMTMSLWTVVWKRHKTQHYTKDLDSHLNISYETVNTEAIFESLYAAEFVIDWLLRETYNQCNPDSVIDVCTDIVVKKLLHQAISLIATIPVNTESNIDENITLTKP